MNQSARAADAVVGVGLDLVSVAQIRRIAAADDAALDLLFTPEEWTGPPESRALSFAAKEAVGKALGVGLDGIAWTDVSAAAAPDFTMSVRLDGAALRRAHALGINAWCVWWSEIDADLRAVVAIARRTTP